MARKYLLARRWLNKRNHESTAFVYGEVEIYGRNHPHVSGTLKIADCDRVVTLDFGHSEANDMHKINTLLATIEDMRDALASAHRDIKEKI